MYKGVKTCHSSSNESSGVQTEQSEEFQHSEHHQQGMVKNNRGNQNGIGAIQLKLY